MSDATSERGRPDHETSGSLQREPRALVGAALDFDIENEVASLQREPSWQQGDRNSRTLVHDPQLRIIVTVMKAGARLREHRTDGAVSIHTLRGHLRLGTAQSTVDLPQGRLVALAPGVSHDLEALDESAFLLTVAWPAGARSAE